MKTIALATLALGSGMGFSTYWAQRQVTIDRTVPAAIEGIVVVRVPNGAIHIEGWDRGEVRVTGTVGPEPDRLEIIERNGYVDIRVIPDLAEPAPVALTVRVPEGSSLDVETADASVEVGGVSGMVRLASVDGALSLSGAPLGFVARSESGDIDVATDDAPGLAHSVDGTVTIRGRPAQATESARCDRRGDCYRFGHSHFGEHDLEHRVARLVETTLRHLDVSGFIDFEARDHDVGVHMSADLALDGEAMERFFEDLELVMEDVEIQVSEGMAVLADELELLGDELRHAGHRHRGH